MERYYNKSLRFIRHTMAYMNFIILLLITAAILLSTRYAIDTGNSRNFLESLSAMPLRPINVFYGTMICYAVLVILMILRKYYFDKKEKLILYTGIFELFIAFMIMRFINMSYSGILYFVYIDIILYVRETKNTFYYLAILAFGLLMSNYNIITLFISMPSLDTFINAFPAVTSTLLLFFIHALEAFNLVCFIIFMIQLYTEQMQETEHYKQEIYMMNQVNTQLQDYAKITEKIGENNERKRLARELHDTVGHALTGISAGIDACITLIDINPDLTKKQLFVLSKVVRDGINDVRKSLNKLRPGALEEHTFKESIVKVVEDFKAVSNMDIHLNFELDKVDFENTKEDVLFRIIQESMTNALRHGHASSMDISLYIKENMVCIDIDDNGMGCKDIHKGFGLTHMEERVSYIGGTVEYNGDHGFHSKIRIPLQRGELYD